MGLSSALNIINSAFVANAAQSAAISSNISNSGTKNYAREITNLITTTAAGSRSPRSAARPTLRCSNR